MGLRIGFSSSKRPKLSTPKIGGFSSGRPAMSPKYFKTSDSPSVSPRYFGTSDNPKRRRRPDIVQPKLDGEPNKYRWKILTKKIVNGMALVEVQYLDCHNYEGKKILVYLDNKKFQKLKKKGVLDPHFLEKHYSPIARFEPTTRGWKMAVHFAKTYKEV